MLLKAHFATQKKHRKQSNTHNSPPGKTWPQSCRVSEVKESSVSTRTTLWLRPWIDMIPRAAVDPGALATPHPGCEPFKTAPLPRGLAHPLARWRSNEPAAAAVVVICGGMGRRSERVRVSELPAMGQMALGLRPRDLNLAANRSHEFNDPAWERSRKKENARCYDQTPSISRAEKYTE